MKFNFNGESRKTRMGYALALSILLHIGAALIFIVAGGFRLAGKTPQQFVIEDINLTHSVSASAAPKQVQAPALPEMTEPMPAAKQPTEAPAQDPAAALSAEPTSIAGQAGLLSTPLGLGITHGYFSGLADGRTLRDDIRGYYFEMVEKINREWWDKAGLLKEPLRQDGIFELLIQRDGTIVSIRLVQGTGLNEADRLLTEIIQKASPMPPLPDTYNLGLFRAPLRIKAPSFLFRLHK